MPNPANKTKNLILLCNRRGQKVEFIFFLHGMQHKDDEELSSWEKGDRQSRVRERAGGEGDRRSQADDLGRKGTDDRAGGRSRGYESVAGAQFAEPTQLPARSPDHGAGGRRQCREYPVTSHIRPRCAPAVSITSPRGPSPTPPSSKRPTTI